MNDLPPELIGRIANYVTRREDLQSLLTVSKTWQSEAERRSQSWKICNLNELRVKEFHRNYNSERLRHLEKITLRTSLTPLALSKEDQKKKDFQEPPCRDSSEELRGINEEFTRQIRCLLNTLKALEDRLDPQELHDLKKITLSIKSPARDVDDWHCIHRKYVSWRINILSPKTLPKISFIRGLEIEQELAAEKPGREATGTSMRVDIRTILDLSASFPNLDFLRCALWHDEFVKSSAEEAILHYTRPWQGPRIDSRRGFTEALQDFAPSKSLKEVNFDFSHRWQKSEEIDQSQELADLTASSPGGDLFSRNLRFFSYQLRKLHLNVVADENLFWPTDKSHDPDPLWPNLETLNVKFQLATPKGGWYFHGLRGYSKVTEGFTVSKSEYPPLGPEHNDEDDEMDSEYRRQGAYWETLECNSFRVIPHDELLVPFLTAFAKAAMKMPVLKRAVLWAPLAFDEDDDDGDSEDESEDEDQSEDQSESGSEGVSEDGSRDEPEDNKDFSVTIAEQRELGWGIVYIASGEHAPDSLVHPGPGLKVSDSRQLWWKVGQWRPELELQDLLQHVGHEQHGKKLLEYWEDHQYGKGLVGRQIFEPNYTAIF